MAGGGEYCMGLDINDPIHSHSWVGFILFFLFYQELKSAGIKENFRIKKKSFLNLMKIFCENSLQHQANFFRLRLANK
jgi:hypothetical protein